MEKGASADFKKKRADLLNKRKDGLRRGNGRKVGHDFDGKNKLGKLEGGE